MVEDRAQVTSTSFGRSCAFDILSQESNLDLELVGRIQGLGVQGSRGLGFRGFGV